MLGGLSYTQHTNVTSSQIKEQLYWDSHNGNHIINVNCFLTFNIMEILLFLNNKQKDSDSRNSFGYDVLHVILYLWGSAIPVKAFPVCSVSYIIIPHVNIPYVFIHSPTGRYFQILAIICSAAVNILLFSEHVYIFLMSSHLEVELLKNSVCKWSLLIK